MSATRRVAIATLGLLVLVTAPLRAEPVLLHAAGSLKAALTDVVAAFEKSSGHTVQATFGPSGVLREGIEKGEPAHVFASADMGHPRKLEADRKGGPVQRFARNALCALARPGLEISQASVLETMKRSDVRVGISTPKSDPSGDYAWQVFERAESVQAGSERLLKAKALQLTGSPTSEKPPADRNVYAWNVDSGRADLFLTYCTNAVLARREVPSLQVVELPAELAVAADYGLIVLADTPEPASALAGFILSREGQEILAGYGFGKAVESP